MGENPEADFVLLAFPGSRAEGAAQEALVAGKDALDLPALAVEPLGETPLHLPSVFLAGPLAGFAAALGGNDALGAQFLPHEDVYPFGIVARIKQGRAEGDPPVGLPQDSPGLASVAPGAHGDFGR